ncbi:hypothetical protein EVA_15198 [gut metagenome]|uniref:Uncharacterized protein n=1 Tax=gut metagenome TaxID=749906 RepID=J9FP39_9ZZZZ
MCTCAGHHDLAQTIITLNHLYMNSFAIAFHKQLIWFITNKTKVKCMRAIRQPLNQEFTITIRCSTNKTVIHSYIHS